MASADGGQQMPQDACDPFPYDGGQQELGGSRLAVPDGPQVPGGGQQMPEHLTIGTKKAFEKELPLPVREDTDRFGDNLCLHSGLPVGSYN